jgi:hypothetical protein
VVAARDAESAFVRLLSERADLFPDLPKVVA